jgi:predicted dehydrogenase
MLAEVRPQIVAVAPRFVDEHHAMITAAIEAGAKGIYMEKPFVRTLAEADDVVRLCKERDVRLAIAHRNRYHPALPVLADLLASGTLGKPLEIRARGKEDHRGGGLDLWVLGSHVLNLAVYLVGKPLACTGMAYQNGIPATEADIHEGDEGVGALVGNAIHARFEMESGVPVFFDSKKAMGQPSANFGLQVICTNGTADLRIDNEPLIHVQMGNPLKPDSTHRAWTPLTSAGLGKAEPLGNIRPLIAGHQQPVLDLLASVGTERQPLCGPEDGRIILEMIHAVFTSHIRGGARVALPLIERRNPLTEFLKPH